MRSEQEMYNLILEVAKNDERVRAVYMNGSRANPNVEKDKYRDFDIVYVVTETKSFLEDKGWISIFGKIAMAQEPDNNDCGWGLSTDHSRTYTWLMLFKDGFRIDLHIQIMEVMLEEYTKDSLTVPLLDKDNILPQIPPSSDMSYYVNRPAESQYKGCCNEFWWCLNNVAKGIVRDQLPYTMWMYNVIVRDMLVKMIDWYIGTKTNFSVSVGMQGKYFKKYLPEEYYKMYADTYSNSDYENIWSSVFTACNLFRILAVDVSENLGYVYNNQDDENMINYLISMRNEWSVCERQR